MCSDPKFLYQIGKITAETGLNMEEGVTCLDDFINITECLRLDFKGREKVKAKYLAGLIFYKAENKDEAYKFFSETQMDLYHLKETVKFAKCESCIEKLFQERWNPKRDLIEEHFYPEHGEKKTIVEELEFY